MGNEKLVKESDVQKVAGKGRRECNGRTALSVIWKEWEETGKQQQKIKGVGDC